MDTVTVQLLGTFAAQTADGVAARFRSDKVRALLAYLATEAAQPHARASLAALLWPEQTDDLALRNLSQTLVQLRAALGDDPATEPPLLLISRQTIQWNRANTVQLDLADFTRLARSNDTAEREQVAALYRGEFLQGFNLPGCEAFEEWLLLTREHYQRQVLALLDGLARAYLDAGKYVEAEAAARRQLELDSWHEAAHRQLMLALAQNGQRASALAHYERSRALLLAELGAEPDPTTTALYEQIRANTDILSTQVSPAVAPLARHSLPTPPDRLIGRADELARIAALLHDPAVRLVTLVGGGGAGKTRLALATAWALVSEPSVELCWVSLAGVSASDAALGTVLATTVLAALDPRRDVPGDPVAVLRSVLHARSLLLVLDNCEHVRASVAALFRDLLDAAPSLRMLATSRERLQLRGEHAILLDGLPVPERDSDDPRAYAGVELFLARAAQRAPDFHEDDATLAAVGRLCRLLGGLPLALEMAASWVEHYHCDEIAAGVSANLAFLATRDSDMPERQRSLHATFTYSWDILPNDEQQALAQLSVFQAAFDRPAAQAVAGADVPTLAALVDRSLLRQSGVGRYEFHPLLRQFAAAQLAAAGPALGAGAANRHSAYYLALAGAQAAALHGPHPQSARLVLQGCLPEIRQACLWTLASSQLDLLETHFTAVASVFNALGLIDEGETFLEQVLAALGRNQDVTQQHMRLRGWVLAELARFQFGRGKPQQGLANAQAAAAAAERAADRDGVLAGYLTTGYAYMLLGDSPPAQTWLERGLALAATAPLHHAPVPGRGMAIMLPMLHNSLAMVAVAERQFTGASHHEAHLRALNQANGDWWGMALAAWWAGGAYLRIGHYARALAWYSEMLEAAERLGVGWYARDCQIRIGQCLARLGQYESAAATLERALASSRAAGSDNQACLALSGLSLVASYAVNYATALRHGRAASELASTLEAHASGQLAARIALGQALIGLGQAAEASGVFADAVGRCRNSAGNVFLSDCLYGQAAAALLAGDHAGARVTVEELLERVAHVRCDALVSPAEIGLVCYRVLTADGDPRAQAVLEQAHTVLIEQAGWIDKPHLRRTFLEDVPAHRAILAAAAGGD